VGLEILGRADVPATSIKQVRPDYSGLWNSASGLCYFLPVAKHSHVSLALLAVVDDVGQVELRLSTAPDFHFLQCGRATQLRYLQRIAVSVGTLFRFAAIVFLLDRRGCRAFCLGDCHAPEIDFFQRSLAGNRDALHIILCLGPRCAQRQNAYGKAF
jgi:hypothetical protein